MESTVIILGWSDYSELIEILSSKINVINSKINIIKKPHNYLYPNNLEKKYGKNIKIIFITKNIKDVINSILQREKDQDINWIKKHYENLNSDFSNYSKILEEDTLNFEKLYDSYIKQKTFDVLFIKYEYLYSNHQGTKDMLSYFLDVNLQNLSFPIYKSKPNRLNFTWDKSLQNKIDSFEFFKHFENVPVRKFFICSSGGCGSKMLCKYLNNFGKSYHFHDRFIPNYITYPFIIRKYKHYNYNDCCYFSDITIENYNIKNYTVIYLYRNPIYCIYSIFNKNSHGYVKEHLQNILCDNINTTLDQILKKEEDLYKLTEFYDNFVNNKNHYNYDIHCIKFEQFFKKLNEFNNYFGLKSNIKLIEKTYKKNMPNYDDLNIIYKNLIDKQDKNDFIYVNKKQDDKINAIFIQSFHKEIITGVLQNFLINLTKLSINIPIVIFLDLKSKQNIQKLDKYIQNISIVYVNDQEYANSVTTIFYKLMNYKILEFPKILLLESDCLVKQNFLNILNNDIKDKDFWIYGSFYYGLMNNNDINRKHINGVAIYYRNNIFLNKIRNVFIKQNYINKKVNYDYILSKNINYNNLIDSKYILNLSTKLDINLDYNKIKKNAVIVHQKKKIFNMITTTYNKINSTRLEETIYSINKNLENDLIEKYFILLEVELTNEGENLYDTYLDNNNNFKGKIKDEFITLLQNPKIEIYLIKNRPTYQLIFDFCNNYHNIIWILSNSDIHFPEWNNHKLKLLLDKDYDIESFVLTRYNIFDDLTDKIKTDQTGIYFKKNNIKYRTQHICGASIDSWIFKTPINIKTINLNFEIGRPECDGRMNFQLSKIRKVINPCLDIISIHKHTNWTEESYNKIICKDKIYNRIEFNKKLNSIGLKHIAIPFSKLKLPIKIAHLINPFKCSEDNPSYLYYAQPITFKSMHNAQLEAQKVGIDVKLYAINYPEDDEIIPEYFIKLPHLKKSTMSEFPKISHNRKLPIIQEMFDSILQNSDADYIIFTNSDIGVQKKFYIEINKFIHKDNLKSFIINRRDNIPLFKNKKRLTEKELNIIYKKKGKTHKGKDCFIINRKILEKINMNLMFTGYPPWGNTLYKFLKRIDKNTHLYKNLYLTFHLGSDKSWNKVKSKLWFKNIEISVNLLYQKI